YITGWCVGRHGEEIRSIRARRGRQKFFGNYGIERKDVGAALERIGFAIAVPLPKGKSQVITEVQESDGGWRPISIRTVFGTSNGTSQAPVDPKYFVHNPGANPRIEFWIDRPLIWQKKNSSSPRLRMVSRDFGRQNYRGARSRAKECLSCTFRHAP